LTRGRSGSYGPRGADPCHPAHESGEPKTALGTDKDILYGEHHLSHAASAFLASPFDEAAIITADGVGEWTTSAWGVGRGTDLELRREIRFPHSVGLLFSAITAYLGFRVNDAEWKVMGLALYGKPAYVDRFRQIVDIKEDGKAHPAEAYIVSPSRTPQTCPVGARKNRGQSEDRSRLDLR